MPAAAAPSPAYELRLSLDLGTSKVIAACQMAEIGEDPSPDRTITIELEDGKNYSPSLIGWVRDGEGYAFCWGHYLRRHLQDGDLALDAHFVFENIKMCIYKSSWQQERRRTVQQELDRLTTAGCTTAPRTPEALLQHYLVHVRRRIDEQLPVLYPRVELDTLPRCWTILVPEVAAEGTAAEFAELVEQAGFPNATQVSKTETAAAYRLREYACRHPGLDDMFQVCLRNDRCAHFG